MSSVPECERDKTLERLSPGIKSAVCCCVRLDGMLPNYAASDKMQQVGQQPSNKRFAGSRYIELDAA
jgi:hypothetical protein